MSIFILDFLMVEDKETLYDYLERVLRLPDWFGRNLDALYDVLEEFGTDTVIVLENTDYLKDIMGEYGEKLLSVIKEASEEPYSFILIEK